MNLWKRLFGKSDDEIASLADREYEQLLLQLLQGFYKSIVAFTYYSGIAIAEG
ncbi:MAG: hypothetical protein LH649_04800 [Pseudanabaena sp. CAN_BIN31]|nr:hypothetical protein [Pseudanabaena sp. CAN_BIN31]